MRRGALVIACAAACGGGTGVDIEIRAPSGMTLDRVELWVAYDRCGDCPNGVAWDHSGRASGEIYFLRDEKVIAASPHGERWVLHLEALAGYGDPSAIAVVGYQSGVVKAIKRLGSVHIPSSTVEIWRVDLHRADRATTDVAIAPSETASVYRAHAWARRPTPELAEPTGCLAYQKWAEDDGVWKTEYFVPPSDPDCDGVLADKECSEYWYEYKPLGSCVSTSLAIAGVCGIGLSPCADGITADRTCGPDPARVFTCLPDVLCASCADMLPADTCIEDAVNSALAANTLPHFECSFDANPDGGSCPEQHVTIQLPYVQAPCGAPALHYLDRPFTEPQSALVFGSGADEVKFFVEANPAGPCQLDIYWIGSSQTVFQQTEVTLLIDVPYDNGTRAVYPVHIHSSNKTVLCGMNPSGGTCVVKGPTEDGVGRCAGML